MHNYQIDIDLIYLSLNKMLPITFTLDMTIELLGV